MRINAWASRQKILFPINPVDLATLVVGRIAPAQVNATTELDLAAHQAADEADAVQDAARFARGVRKRLGLSQMRFSRRIEVDWEQGKCCPTWAAKALLRCWTGQTQAALAALR